MSKTTNVAARPALIKVQEPAIKSDKASKKTGVDIEALHEDLQNKRKLLNLLEEKGVAHKIDVKAIDKALADLYAIMESREPANIRGGIKK